MTYQWEQMVQQLAKPGEAILSTLTPEKADLWHAATGLAGEVGELVDAVKKHVVYNKHLDVENMIEELGDIEFYLEMIRQNRLLLISRTACLTTNYSKLVGRPNARYASGTYSDQQAQDRRDKVNE